MNWKTFKNLFNTEKYDESQFILGIDLGDATSAICYFDPNRNSTEIIDISGGYGKASVPTVIQYIPDTKEWVFGEYAMLNRGIGSDITLNSLIEKLGLNEYIEIDGKPVSVINILSIYLKELIGSCRNINPKAEVAGIIVSVPNYITDEAVQELKRCFSMAGFEKELIDFVPQRECILNYHYHNKRVTRERIMLLDFGSREMRGGIYDIAPGPNSVVEVNTLSYMFDGGIGTKIIDQKVVEIFTALYLENTGGEKSRLKRQIKDQISAFAYQHKDFIFQKNILNRAVKLYFNFAYPPFQSTFTKDDAENLTNPFKERLYSFFEQLLNNSINRLEPIDAGDITAILCTGGGFEMLWAREAVEDIFPDSNIALYKNSKAVTAEGAAVLAAARLGVIEEKTFIVSDKHQVKEDIGVYAYSKEKKRFVPLIERNTFWWQNGRSCKLIINEKTDQPIHIDILRRSAAGDIHKLSDLMIEGLPERPKGVTKIDLKLEYTAADRICATIRDMGFGEIFPAEDFNKDYEIAID